MVRVSCRAGTAFAALFLLPLFSLASQETDDGGYLFIDEKGITVLGTAETSQQISIIEREEIERRASSGLASLLQETLDANVSRYGGYGNQARVNLRGFDSSRVAFLIDGVPVNAPQDGEFDINQIDLSAVERIEVIYGGSDTKYNVSGALGGIINIVTVKKQASGLRLNGAVSNTSALPGAYEAPDGSARAAHAEDLLDAQNISLSAAYGAKNISATANLFANRAANHFMYKDFTGKIRRKDNNDLWDSGASASLVWSLPDLAKFIVSSNFYYSDKNIPLTGYAHSFGNQQDMAARQNIMLDMPRVFYDSLSTEASLAWHGSRRDYEAPAGALSQHNQQVLTAINRWSWHSGERLTLRSGVEYHFTYLDSTEMQNRSRHDGGVYLTAEYQPVKRLLIIPSIKAVFANKGETNIAAVPKLGLVWNAAHSFTLKNNYFRGFKLPDFEDLYWSDGGADGNPDLKNEDGWGADLGVIWKFRSIFKLESTFFAQWTVDSIHWYNTSGVWKPENVGEAVFFGLDSKLRFELPVARGPVKKIVPALSYQYLLSYLLSYGYTWAAEKRIPYMPAHTLGGSLDILWESGSLLVAGHYESLRYADTANLKELKPHFLLSVTLNQKLSKNLSAFCAGRNLLNISYESFDGYPMPGITLTLGIRMRLEVPHE